MKLTSILVAGALPLLVMGCNSTDPNKGGFIGGVRGITSGNYDAYVDRRKAIRDEELAKLEAEERREARLSREVEKSKAERARLRREVRALERDAEELRADASRFGADKLDDDTRARITRVQRQLAQLSTELRVEEAPKSVEARLASLRAEVKRLRSVVAKVR